MRSAAPPPKSINTASCPFLAAKCSSVCPSSSFALIWAPYRSASAPPLHVRLPLLGAVLSVHQDPWPRCWLPSLAVAVHIPYAHPRRPEQCFLFINVLVFKVES